jgi:hypothetical protein
MKFFIGPMSKNVVDTIIEFSKSHKIDMVFIPSRRQIEYNGGYVNNWTTKDFVQYVHSKCSSILIERDHGGPGQGNIDDDGFESLKEDTKYFDIIHIDPWKKYPNFDEGLKMTIDMIRYCYNINPNIQYEIATEEGIRKFEVNELERLIIELQKNLNEEEYKQIKYLVIQCGTKLLEKTNTGSFDVDKLKDMIQLCNKYGFIAKEHNGDWVTSDIVDEKCKYGLTCINIAPEFGEIETTVLLEYFKKYELFEEFYNICFNSKKWVKWVSTTFVPEENKEQLILICGHYTFAYKEFVELKQKLIDDYKVPIDTLICDKIKFRLENLYKK